MVDTSCDRYSISTHKLMLGGEAAYLKGGVHGYECNNWWENLCLCEAIRGGLHGRGGSVCDPVCGTRWQLDRP